MRPASGGPASDGVADRPAVDRGERFFGRRHGRTLRPLRRRLLDEVLPALALPPPSAIPLDPGRLFPGGARPVWLEIGFGAGEHLLAQARRHPGIGFIGAEPFVNGIAALLAAWQADPVDNLRLYADDARLLLPTLADASIDRVFLLFPDPWPKLRHADRRFIGRTTVAALARILADDGELRIATDAPRHARWMLGHLAADTDFAWQARRCADWRLAPADWVPTRYERKAAAAGRPTIHLRFRRLSRPCG